MSSLSFVSLTVTKFGLGRAAATFDDKPHRNQTVARSGPSLRARGDCDSCATVKSPKRNVSYAV
jgi:hypothetical protein